jgi:hypothetical protein
MSCIAVAHRHTPADIFMQVGFRPDVLADRTRQANPIAE